MVCGLQEVVKQLLKDLDSKDVALDFIVTVQYSPRLNGTQLSISNQILSYKKVPAKVPAHRTQTQVHSPVAVHRQTVPHQTASSMEDPDQKAPAAKPAPAPIDAPIEVAAHVAGAAQNGCVPGGVQ